MANREKGISFRASFPPLAEQPPTSSQGPHLAPGQRQLTTTPVKDHHRKLLLLALQYPCWRLPEAISSLGSLVKVSPQSTGGWDPRSIYKSAQLRYPRPLTPRREEAKESCRSRVRIVTAQYRYSPSNSGVFPMLTVAPYTLEPLS